MAKCDKCQHKGICKHEENIKKYENEIREKSKLMKYQTFHADIRCDNYMDGKATLSLPYDDKTKEWFREHIEKGTIVCRCEKCNLYYKPSLGHECRK